MKTVAEEVLERPGGYPTLLVPKNEEGIRLLEMDIEDEENIRWCSLRDEESNALRGAFSELNEVFNINIDSFEEEYIDATDAPRAMNIVQRWQEHPESAVQAAALTKLQRALEAAIEYGTYVELAL